MDVLQAIQSEVLLFPIKSLAVSSQVVLNILSFTDFHTLMSFQRTCKRHSQIVKSHSERIFREIFVNSGLCGPLTGPDFGTGILSRRAFMTTGRQGGEGGREMDLTKAIVDQRSASGYYSGASSFEDLARRRTLLDRRWRNDEFNIKATPSPRVWGVKLDTERSLLLASTDDGRIRAVHTISDTLIWEVSIPNATNLNLNYSQGYLIHSSSLSDKYIYVWRHKSIQVPDPPEVDPSSFPTSTTPEFVPHAKLEHPVATFWLKARYPYLLMGTTKDEPRVTVWDFEKNESVTTVKTLSGSPAEHIYWMSNLEADGDHIFVSTESCVDIFRMSDGQLASTIPPNAMNLAGRHPERGNRPAWDLSPPSQGDINLPANYLSQFVSVQYSHPHLLALTKSGLLYWTCRYPQSISGSDPFSSQDWVVLSLSGLSKDPARPVEARQICVENGRAAVTVVSRDIKAFRRTWAIEDVFLLNLEEWDSHEHFKTLAPKIEPLQLFHPSDTAISGIEMDSTSIYVPARNLVDLKTYTKIVTEDLKKGTASRRWEGYKASCKWKTLDGEELADAWRDGTPPGKDESVKRGGLDAVLNSIGGQDCCLVYNFF